MLIRGYDYYAVYCLCCMFCICLGAGKFLLNPEVETDHDIRLGSSAVLRCVYAYSPGEKSINWYRAVNGSKHYRVIWFFRGHNSLSTVILNKASIEGRSNFASVFQTNYETQHSIRMLRASKEDQGDYSCTIHNRHRNELFKSPAKHLTFYGE